MPGLYYGSDMSGLEKVWLCKYRTSGAAATMVCLFTRVAGHQGRGSVRKNLLRYEMGGKTNRPGICITGLDRQVTRNGVNHNQR
jgi:hypothetical protein